MAIDADSINTEITLEIDEAEIPVGEFTKAVDGFFGLIKELAKQTMPGKDASAWVVEVYPGSAGVGVNTRPGAYTTNELAIIRESLISGLQQIERGERPVTFTDKAIEHSRLLGNLFKSKKGPAHIRIWGRREIAFPVTRTIATRAAEMLDAAYEDDGSIDGFLEKLSAHGQFEFVVYDALDNRAIKCEVREDKLEEALKAFRQRVEVLGTVRYRRDGMPVSVKAREIISFPSPDQIPSVETMRQLLAGANGS